MGLRQLRKEPRSKAVVEAVPLVELATVGGRSQGFDLEVDGEVAPHREVTLSAMVAGKITYKSEQAKSGSFVQAGTLLMEIDPQDYQLQIERQQQFVNQTNDSIEELDVEKSNALELEKLARAELELHRATVKRNQDLIQQRAVSDAILEDSRKAQIRALNALQTYSNQVSLLGAKRNRLLREKESAITSLKQAKLDLERTKIVATMNGVVMEDMVAKDDYVRPGEPLIQIEDTEKVEVRFELRFDQLRWLWNDVEVAHQALRERGTDFRLPPLDVDVVFKLGGSSYSWRARLSRYDGAGINPKTRTMPCIAIVDHPEDGHPADALTKVRRSGPPTLLRGMFVTVRIPISNNVDLIEIPKEALRPGYRVWTVKNGSLNVKQVRVASFTDSSVVLIDDDTKLTKGDQVIVSPLPLVVDGMEVRTHRPTTFTAAKSTDEAT